MKLSVIIPALNEAVLLPATIRAIHQAVAAIDHEIIVIDDHSTDGTEDVLDQLRQQITTFRWLQNGRPRGYGNAVRFGLEHFEGDCVAIMMADLSDDPQDLVAFYREMNNGNFDCVFGSRFIKGGAVHNYPRVKLILNRLANHIVKVVFRVPYNDMTNAFKLYRRNCIEGIQPLLSPHFNLTLEMPLKAIVRGYNYTVLPNSWKDRTQGQSNLKIKEMGSRYFFIFLYCFIEKYFSKGDYQKKT